MKIQLDTTAKQIKIEETVNLGELTEALERLLPNGVWKEFKLETHTTIHWTNLIVVEPYRPFNPNPYPWWQQPWITYGTSTDIDNYSLNAGTYNIEMRNA